MPYEEKDLSGIIFVNDRKEKGSKQPDFTGRCLIRGEAFQVSAWKKRTRDDKPFLTLSFRGKQETQR